MVILKQHGVLKRTALKCGAVIVLAAGLLLSACQKDPYAPGHVKEGLVYEKTGIAPDTAAVLADGNEISFDLYLYWLCHSTRRIESYLKQNGMDLDWDYEISQSTSVLDYVRIDALNSVRYFAVIESMAKEYAVSLSDADKAALQEQKDAYIAKLGSEEEYLRQIALLGLRPEIYERINAAGRLYSDLYDLYVTEGSRLYASDEDVAAYAEAQGAVTADQILLLTMDMTTKERYSQDIIDAKIALIEDIYHRLCDSERPQELFQELADEYSEDIGRQNYPNGYTYMPGAMIKEFETAAEQLKPGEFSLITESVYGFHIIMRKELDVSAAAAGMRNTYFDALIAARVNAMTIEMNPQLEQLNIPAYYSAFSDAWESSALFNESIDSQP